jgi:c-di-GMP-binding flagellar brake protein YcgR
MDDEQQDQRDFERFPVEFEAEVTVAGKKAETKPEKAKLMNISGGGARFKTSQPERYKEGERIEITIMLPGSEKQQACMKGMATIMWVNTTEINDKETVSIGVSMDDLLTFEDSSKPSNSDS